jgi:PAS domain S-box-containing protein
MANSNDQMEPSTGWQGLFWDAFRQSRNAMILLDDQRRLVEVNGAFVRLLGHARPSLVGRPVYDLRAAGRPASDREWQAALHQRQFTAVAELGCADGSRVRIEFAGHPEIVTGKRLVLVVILHADRRNSLRRVGGVASTEPRALSRRELDVVRLIALGLNGPEIAEELQVSHNTVRTHIRNAMSKTGSRSRAELVAKALAQGTAWPQANAFAGAIEGP